MSTINPPLPPGSEEPRARDDEPRPRSAPTPPVGPDFPPRRRSRRLAGSLRLLEERFSDEYLARIAARLLAATDPPAATPEEDALVAALTGGRAFTADERIDLEARSLGRHFARRRSLLAGSLTAPEAAALLGVSRQTPHDRARAGTLLAVEDAGRLRFPAWQFDPQGPHGVVAGLPEVLKALPVPPFTRLSWLQSPSPYLEGRTPLGALTSGELDRVLSAAYAVGAA